MQPSVNPENNMKKLVKIAGKELWEKRLRGNLKIAEEIRSDGLSDLDSLSTDFQHMMLVVESVQRNYKALLEQNQQLKAMLLKVVDECYCWEGNRCDRCGQILMFLAQGSDRQQR